MPAKRNTRIRWAFSELRERLAKRMTDKTGVAYIGGGSRFHRRREAGVVQCELRDVSAGDEVIIPSPYWVTFPEQVRLAGATPVALPTAEQWFSDRYGRTGAKLITPRTRGIILNTPHNPTGVVYSGELLEKDCRGWRCSTI